MYKPATGLKAREGNNIRKGWERTEFWVGFLGFFYASFPDFALMMEISQQAAPRQREGQAPRCILA